MPNDDSIRKAAAVTGAAGLFLIAIACVVFVGLAVIHDYGSRAGVALLGAVAMRCIDGGIQALRETAPDKEA